ncbi:disease resistance protein RPV1 [Daucus carota subsp. sativus]|uniref:disease resistance protein RPV1 n=1 Tax=Daucus carota subsp. sativus TaxID=79200 RepID=UPI003082F948
MAFVLWETLKESITAYADLSPATLLASLTLGLALFYAISVMLRPSAQPQQQVNNEVTTRQLAAVTSFPPWDVFLSFRGQDTRKNFIGHLYHALDQAGIVTFRDDPALEKGQEISSGLREAIRTSKMFLLVISKNYADSSWCLDELVEILSCKRTNNQVIPVFYYVNPSDLRHHTGSFGVALKKHRKRHSVDRIQKWKSALTEVADLSGYHLEHMKKESEADTIQNIVEIVLSQASTKVIHLERFLYGIDHVVEEIYGQLSMESYDVRALGICGMGGIGKTTITKAFYNKYAHEFDISCFMENVKQSSQGASPPLSLLHQLLRELLRVKDLKFRDSESALRKLREILSSNKALIVFDDLDQTNYSELVVEICKMLSDGSRMIITARDLNLPNQLKVEMSKVDTYVVKRLNESNSLELFSYHAFKKSKPPGRYLALSKSGRTDVSFWKVKLEKVKKIPMENIQKILQLSYDELEDDTHKAIFLDIVFFFLGKKIDEAVDVFRSCDFFPECGIPILVERCLLTIDFDNRLRMHNLIQDMGRNVIHEQSKHGRCRRLYLDHEEASQALPNQDMDKIEALLIDCTLSTNKYCHAELFERLPNLRLLKLVDVYDIKGNFKTSFHELRCISWHGCPWMHLPYSVRMQKLVFLDMPFSRLERLWKIAKLPSLRHLNLEGCKYLKALPHSIGRLTALYHLNLNDCVNLKRLPKPITQLTTLSSLNMRKCSNLKLLPEQLGDLKCLKMLDVSLTAIEQLPDSIAHLKKLVYFKLEGSKQLRKLPEQFGNMEALEEFNACHSGIEQLPDSFSNLLKLRSLNLRGCSELKRLPEQLGKMQCLERLEASYTAIEELPDSIGLLPRIQVLNFGECKKLRKLPEQFGNMEALEELDAGGSAIEQLPDSFSNLLKLRSLNLSYCSELKRLPEQLGKMQCLEELYASDTAIEELPDSIGLLPRIQALNFGECKKLTYVPNSICNLKSLEYLNLFIGEDIIKFELIEAVNDMKLEYLSLSCNIRVWLPIILSFSSPRILSLRDECGSPSPTKPFSFFQLFNLQVLTLTNSTSHGSSFPELPLNLKELIVDKHASLEQVPDLSYLKHLNEMSIIRCCSLQSLHKLPPHVEFLTVEDCTSLQDFPDVSMLSDLKRLNVLRNGSNLKVSLEKNHLQLGRGYNKAFSAALQNREIAEWFDYKNREGCTLSFHVPPNLGDHFVGVAFWVVYKCSYEGWSEVEAVITNITEGITIRYTISYTQPPYDRISDAQSTVNWITAEDIPIKSGDKIMISFEVMGLCPGTEVNMCGAHILKQPNIIAR